MTTVPHGPRPGKRLVVFAPNWLGDAVMALPAIADLRRARRDDFLAIAARPAVRTLFSLVDGIDAVVGPTVADLSPERFDEAVLLPNSFRSALIAWRAGIPRRAGYRAEGRGVLLTHGVARGPRGHQAAYYQHLVSALGSPNGEMQPRAVVSATLRETAGALLRDAGWDGRRPLVAFAPGSANGRAKQWPAESFAAVARTLASDGVAVALVGAPGDRRAADDILQAIGGDIPAIDLVGRTDLTELAGVLIHCRAFVGNDSGAMHLGAALGVPVIAMFGPSNEKETRPLGGGRTTVLTSDVWCRPCMLRECPLDHRCMRGISPDAVVRAARGELCH